MKAIVEIALNPRLREKIHHLADGLGVDPTEAVEIAIDHLVLCGEPLEETHDDNCNETAACSAES